MAEKLQLSVRTIHESDYPIADAGKVERRVMAIEDIELRVTDDDKPRITGYIAKFGKWSLDLGGFREKIKVGAFDEAVEKSDVRCLKNHDINLLLGRTSSGTLRLKTNSVGLNFEDDVPDTNTGKDTVTEIRRRDITGCSFSFTTAEDDWKYLEDGSVERTIIKVGELFDVGPVTYPAYPDTTVAARSLERVRAEHENTEDNGQESRAEDVPAVAEETEETEESKKIKRERRIEIQRGYREAGCILKRVTDLINEINND